MSQSRYRILPPSQRNLILPIYSEINSSILIPGNHWHIGHHFVSLWSGYKKSGIMLLCKLLEIEAVVCINGPFIFITDYFICYVYSSFLYSFIHWRHLRSCQFFLLVLDRLLCDHNISLSQYIHPKVWWLSCAVNGCLSL